MGELIHNRYELIEALGVGGMGAVFRAYDQHLNREVALKVARVEPPDAERMAEATLFLKREARALGRLKHPSIPVVYDYSGETARPRLPCNRARRRCKPGSAPHPQEITARPRHALYRSALCSCACPCPPGQTRPRRYKA